jgi:hypothetical protein
VGKRRPTRHPEPDPGSSCLKQNVIPGSTRDLPF